MDGGDAAGMAGVPGLEHVERLAAADLADDDAVGPQAAASTARDPPARRRPALVRRATQSGRGALQFAGVFDQDHPLIELGHLGQQRVGERGLARAGAAGDQDVAAVGDRAAERIGLRRRHDAVGDIVAEACRCGAPACGW